MKQMNFEDVKNLLGKEVSVVMDRPLGSKHPKWGFVYDVNYGYIPNTVSGDGEELDAYVLGEDRPLNNFSGVVKGIVHRTNDDDDKLLVVDKNKKFSREEIYEFVKFQEKNFDSIVIFKKDKSIPFIQNGELVDIEKSVDKPKTK